MLLLAASCAAPRAGGVGPPPAERDALRTDAMPAAGARQWPTIPDTPAGHALRAWLEAFNSGERARIEGFVARYKPPRSADEMLTFRKQTGGFDLLTIEKSDPLHIEFRVQEKAGPTTALGKLEVRDADPAELVTFGLRAIPPGMTAADMTVAVDAATRARVLDGIVAKLTEFYVYPETASKMTRALRAHQKRGAYDAIRDGDAFASLLTDHLRAVSHDGHLRVDCVPMVLPEEEPSAERPGDRSRRSRRSRPSRPRMRAQLERIHCGFERSERLDSAIGYVKLNLFADPAICGPRATAALAALGDVDALVFDLRDNGGGEPEMVAFVSSYLFQERTHLNDIYDRKANQTTEYWTTDVPGKKFASQPVFVLTSRRTFSGGEEFAYNLKHLKRATIVGETTGGGAHPTAEHRVDDHFRIGVPFARAVNPITKTNWEGKGVEPDVKVPADQALEVARKLAAEQIKRQRQK